MSGLTDGQAAAGRQEQDDLMEKLEMKAAAILAAAQQQVWGANAHLIASACGVARYSVRVQNTPRNAMTWSGSLPCCPAANLI